MKENGFPGLFLYRLKRCQTPTSPLCILGAIALAIFVGETAVMSFLALLPPVPVFPDPILDSTLLIVVTSPALYLFLFQPFIRHVKQRKIAEKSVRKSNDLLQIVFNGISDPLILIDGVPASSVQENVIESEPGSVVTDQR